MAGTAWWNPFGRKRREGVGAGAGAVPAPLQSPPPPPPLSSLSADARDADDAASDSMPGLAADSAASSLLDSPSERNPRFFAWLLGVYVPPASTSTAAADAATQLLERLDEIIASEPLRTALLPRAPHVVPQLMKTLRDEHYSSADVANRISKDVVLTAAVVRSATSAFGRSGDDGEIDLARAVAMIGTAGLRRAIASVVLRPIFDARGDTLSARAARPIWQDADRKARLGSALAAHAGLDPFDGYLAGLLFNSGWTALLRAIDGIGVSGLGAAGLARGDVVAALLPRRDALYGALVESWHLSPALDELAAAVGGHGLKGAAAPLGVVLREADRLAAIYALTPRSGAPAESVPGWAELPEAVQACYATLGEED